MKHLIICTSLLIFSCFSCFAQANFYLEPQIGANVSFARHTSTLPHFYKVNTVGPAFNFLVGVRLGRNTIIESGILLPQTSLKYKIVKGEKNNILTPGSTHIFGRAFNMIPLMIRKDYKLKDHTLILRLGAAMAPLSSPGSISGTSGSHDSARTFVNTSFTENGYNNPVTLIAGIGVQKRYGKIGTFSLNLMYGQGLMEVMKMHVNYTQDGNTFYTTNFSTKGSFLSLQLGYVIARRISVRKVD